VTVECLEVYIGGGGGGGGGRVSDHTNYWKFTGFLTFNNTGNMFISEINRSRFHCHRHTRQRGNCPPPNF
jgi:hypothetical protein